MNVLGIETATIVCGAAVVVDGKLLGEARTVEQYVHAESIVRLIDESLRFAHLTIHQIDAIAVSIGPGSFTGLRIGLSVAKGFSYALEKPIVAVPTLRALAQRALDANLVATHFILPAIDARRDEVYCQLFSHDGAGIIAEWDERDCRVGALPGEIGGRAVTVTGDAVQKVKMSVLNPTWRYVETEFARCSAADVAALGEKMLMRREIADAAALEPKYVKEFYLTAKS